MGIIFNMFMLLLIGLLVTNILFILGVLYIFIIFVIATKVYDLVKLKSKKQ